MWPFRRCKHPDQIALYRLNEILSPDYTKVVDPEVTFTAMVRYVRGWVWACPDCGKVWYEGEEIMAGQGEG